MSRKVSLDLERSPVGLGLRKVGQWVDYGDFTDGTAADGTLNLSKQIPAGSAVAFSKVTVVEAFTGDGVTSVALNIGNSGDDDAYSLTAHSIFTVANNLMEAADSEAAGDGGFNLATSDTTVLLTATAAGGGDWGLIDTGRMYVEVFYLSTNPEIIDISQTRYDG